MTLLARAQRARIVLLATLAGASLLWAGALVAALVGVAALTDLLVPVPLAARRVVVPLAILGAIAGACRVVARGWRARSLDSVALFIEERAPALQFAFATAVHPAGELPPDGMRALERAVGVVDLHGLLRPAVLRALAMPAAILVAGLATGALVPDETLTRILAPRVGDVLLRPAPRAGAPLANRLVPIAVRVEPPRYARRAMVNAEDPAAIAALVGSRIDVRGRGAAAGVTDSLFATLGAATGTGTPLAMRTAGDTWGVRAVMPGAPAVLRLTDRGYDRLLILEPIPDEPPALTLTLPRTDTLLITPKGRLELDAEAADDIGLGHAHFEVLYTSGSGERYETKRTVISATSLGGRRTTRLRTSILLDTMKLKAGDVLHVRALAWDENDITGPGKGESETRTIRIHDPRQLLNVNITAAKAAAIDTSILSQRMLIMRAETLLVQRQRLQPEEYTTRSLRLGVQQGALRGRVESIVHELENVEGVGFVGNTPSSLILREAAEEMRNAERELSIAQVPVALVHMRAALKLLEKIRDANRYWLRGLLTTTPIDIDRVRLTGTDAAQVGGRESRDGLADPRRALRDRLDRAVALLERDASAGRDSLQFVFAVALSQARDVAEPLGKAVEALQRGADATASLVAARRRLERRIDRTSAPSSWFGAP